MAKIFVETERLILRELVPEDAERMFLLDSNPEVMRFLGRNTVTKVEESSEIIEKIRKQYRENGIGRWAVVEKSSNLLIGWSGLKFLTEEINGFKNVYELGYRFLPESWGKGYASESAGASLNYGFNILDVGVIYASATIDNAGSNHVLRKLGFTEKGTFIDPLDHEECFWYELRKEDFQR